MPESTCYYCGREEGHAFDCAGLTQKVGSFVATPLRDELMGRDTEASQEKYYAEYKRILDNTADDGRDKIIAECEAIKAMLLAKNQAYGNSALSPVRVFSRADAVEQIRVRIDDKLSRLARGSAAGDDTTLDLIGYLILLRIAERG